MIPDLNYTEQDGSSWKQIEGTPFVQHCDSFEDAWSLWLYVPWEMAKKLPGHDPYGHTADVVMRFLPGGECVIRLEHV